MVQVSQNKHTPFSNIFLLLSSFIKQADTKQNNLKHSCFNDTATFSTQRIYMEEMMGAGGGSGGGSGGDRPKGRPQEQLNCPRCKSSNTKFCYYNNYSLTQPRYFCKACRRYWTEGGSLRNIPVGGGSRKNRKSSGSVAAPHHALPPVAAAFQPHDLNLGFPPTSGELEYEGGPEKSNSGDGFGCYIPNLMPYSACDPAEGHGVMQMQQNSGGGRFGLSFSGGPVENNGQQSSAATVYWNINGGGPSW